MPKTPLAEKAYKEIKDWIIQYILKPGTILNIGELSKAIHMSPTPVREALSKLEQEYLVEYRPMRGYAVTSLSLQDVTDIYEVRIVLEVLAAQQAAKRITKEELKQLRKTIAVVWDHIKVGNKNGVLEQEQHVHFLILQASGNRLLKDTAEGILNRIWMIQNINVLSNEHLEKAHYGHEDMLKALEERDSRKAGALMREHVKTARDIVLCRLKTKSDVLPKIITGTIPY